MLQNHTFNNGWTSQMENCRKTLNLNYTLKEKDLEVLKKIFHPTATEYAFFQA